MNSSSPQEQAGSGLPTPTERFRRARDYLLSVRQNYATAYREFEWPQFSEFNWALDYFDVMATGNHTPAL